MALNARRRFNKSSLIECHRNRDHRLTMKVTNHNTLLFRRLHHSRAGTISFCMEKYFVSLNAINLDIGGDRVKNVLWQAISLPLPSSERIIAVQCETNNISTIPLVILLIVSLM